MNNLLPSRKYAMQKNQLTIFHFVIDSDRNIRILDGNMKGYVISPENQHTFTGSNYNIIDVGEAPDTICLKIGTVKARPCTPPS